MARTLHNTTMNFGNDPFNIEFLEFGEQMLLELRYVPTIALVGEYFRTHDAPYLELNPVNAMCDDNGYNLADKRRLVAFGNTVLQELRYKKRLHIVEDEHGIPRIRAYRLDPQPAAAHHPPEIVDGVVIYNGVLGEQHEELLDEQEVGPFLLHDHPYNDNNNILNPVPLFAIDEEGHVVDFDGRRTRLLNFAVLAAIADLFVIRNPTQEAPLTRQEVHQHVVHTMVNRYGIGASGVNLDDRYVVSLVDSINAIEPVIPTMQKYVVMPGPASTLYLGI